jgi:hypothetical protein
MAPDAACRSILSPVFGSAWSCGRGSSLFLVGNRTLVSWQSICTLIFEAGSAVGSGPGYAA